MKTYKAGPHTDAKLHAEFSRIESAAMRADPYAQLDYLHASPERILAGMIVLADGSDLSLGAHPGLYFRSEDNTEWLPMGDPRPYSHRFMLMGA